LFNVSKKRLKVDFLTVFRSESMRHDGVRLFSEVHSERMRGGGHKLQQGKLQLDTEKEKNLYEGGQIFIRTIVQ